MISSYGSEGALDGYSKEKKREEKRRKQSYACDYGSGYEHSHCMIMVASILFLCIISLFPIDMSKTCILSIDTSYLAQWPRLVSSLASSVSLPSAHR